MQLRIERPENDSNGAMLAVVYQEKHELRLDSRIGPGKASIMNPLPPKSVPSKSVNSLTSQTALRTGQIPLEHDLLDWEQVETLAEKLDSSLERLEERFADYVTNVSVKKQSQR
jgi:hypothetical protein